MEDDSLEEERVNEQVVGRRHSAVLVLRHAIDQKIYAALDLDLDIRLHSSRERGVATLKCTNKNRPCRPRDLLGDVSFK